MNGVINVVVKASSCLASSPKNQADTTSGHCEKISLPVGTTVTELLHKLQIRADMTETILVGGKICRLEKILEDGDRIEVYPIVCGG